MTTPPKGPGGLGAPPGAPSQPRNVSTATVRPGVQQTGSSSSAAAAPAPSSFVNTPPVPQIPIRPPRASFSSTSRRPSMAAGAAAEGGDSNGLGTRTAVSARSTSSALTASRGPTPNPATTGDDDNPFDESEAGASTPAAGESAFSNINEVPDEEKARVLRRHLMTADERGSKSSTPARRVSPAGSPGGGSIAPSDPPGESSVSAYGSTSRRDDDAFPIPYDAPGMDVTHDLYKWQNDHRPRPGRSASFSHADRSDIVDPTMQHIKEPGGFRRNFVSARAAERGDEAPPMVRNVIDFLYLYGHFAGEDLDEDEDLEDEDEEAAAEQAAAEEGRRRLGSSRGGSPGPGTRAANERSPLLKRSLSHGRQKRQKSTPGQGTATVTQAWLMLLKGFVGTGILFMAKAFYNGGMVFSTVVLLAIAAISLWSFLLLVDTYLKVPMSFGDMGGHLYGKYMRISILTSIAVSQIGFVAAYTIFVAENLQAFVLAVTDCKTFISTRDLIFAQLLLFLPLSMIRNLAKLSFTALVADAFILLGLLYIGGTEISVIAKNGLPPPDVAAFNPKDFPLLIGTAVFAFEGIGLVIPIAESMKEPKKIHGALTGVMIIVATLFTTFGVLGYAAYGSKVQTVVIVNLPQEEHFVQGVQFLYSLAILLSIPLQLFPAVRIMETGLFSRSGKHNPKVKWQKNIFRAGTVIFCSLLSWAGSSELDKFVSLIGAFACIPLCFIYPPMLHLRGCATTRRQKLLDCLLIAFGFIVGVYTTIQTLRSLFAPGGGEAPRLGKCEVPNVG
ncbi:Vacuolar amino acid transporter 3 [Vanrija pseudolonga]|uniref:Vacuolar amino acid transporter 3 n=1 Tax=Vanrija pseudolonga TaxID=143232 RepID=A0AAF0Y0V5_9TREE|nr:Vacuolar amino acid transporter 3 [Vanrija pseudolonga]